jgi:hypothetical protein
MAETASFAALQDWQPDPWERFDQRYFSRGRPTPLVRNGRVESRDEPVGPLPLPVPAPEPEPLVALVVDEVSFRARRAALVVFVAAVVPLAVLVAFSASARSFVFVTMLVLYAAVAGLVGIQHWQRVPRNWRDTAPETVG